MKIVDGRTSTKIVQVDRAGARIVRLASGVSEPGPPVPVFEFTQELPAATWTITHNIGRLPAVDVYIDGELVETDVDSTASVTTLTFPMPLAGVAILF